MNVGLLEIVAAWVGKMLRMFGLGEGELNEIGWGEERLGSDNVNVSDKVIFIRVDWIYS